jgi:DNA-binding CsgD family transcriptional regulator
VPAITAVPVGRRYETARLDALVATVRAGGSAVVVITGEPGIGKSCLLDHVASRASGMTVLRSRGAESEQNLPFAGLVSLAGPVLDHLDALPERQRAALAAALAVGPPVAADRFAVCAATLSLFGAAATRRPVLALVDDAHWLDSASAQALEFTALRLGAEGVGIVIAVRAGSPTVFDPARFDVITLTGLSSADSLQLLAASGRTLAPAVARQLVSGSGGNPLAMLALAGSLTEMQSAGRESLPEPLPVADALARALDQRLGVVSPRGLKVLLLAAADTAADLTDIAGACAALSADVADLAEAEEAGVVTIGSARVEFAHPLLRSAAYHRATAAERRRAHQALGDCAAARRDAVRSAWHLAAAAIGADEATAVSLDRAAAVALERNAFVAASQASRRAAELTVDTSRQFGRWQAAGVAAHRGGDAAAAEQMLTQAIAVAQGPLERADAQMLLAHAAVWTTLPMTLHYQLTAQAESVLPFSPSRAAMMHALAALPCVSIGRLDLTLRSAGRAMEVIGETRGRPWLIAQAALALARIITGERTAGQDLLGPVLPHLRAANADLGLSFLRMMCGRMLIWCEELQAAADLIEPTIDEHRARGQLADLAYGLSVSSELRYQTGAWAQAYADATEAVEFGTDFADATDIALPLACAARIEAATGARTQAREHLDRALSIAAPRGEKTTLIYAASICGLLELGAGDYVQAAASLSKVADYTAAYKVSDPCVFQWRPDYVEALAGAGRTAEAAEQLAILEDEAGATGSRWATAAAARCAGLLASAADVVSAREHAVKLAEASAGKFELARARLYLGEALRRGKHRSQAQPQLAAALQHFQELGATVWASRAAAELRATGEAAGQAASPSQKATLTPQELRVALKVADGLSNKEVASRLFLSPRTVEVHLGHIYDKLGVRSRTALVRLIAAGGLEHL